MEAIASNAAINVPSDEGKIKTLHDHLYEHCYSKLQLDSNEPMDTDPPPVTPSEISIGLTSLNQDQDTFETVLLQLLQTFTRHQRQSSSRENSPSEQSKPHVNKSIIDISAEALNTLSSEQVMALVTSNSVNYEVIQQIRAQRHPSVGKVPSDSNSGTPIEPPKTEGASVDASQQLLQVSPEQLQLLQTQLAEMLSQQKVTIPADLSPEQQLELIQSLLVQQLNTPQDSSEPNRTTAKSAPPPSKKPKTASPPSKTQPKSQVRTRPNSTSSGTTGKRKREPVKKEPKKPPKPYNIFFGEVYSTVMAANSKMSLPEASKIISTMWEAMGEDVKKRYKEAYEKLEEEYQVALQEYQASNQQPAEKPTTLQQLLTKSTSANPPPPSKADSKPMSPHNVSQSAPTGMDIAIQLKTEPVTTLSNSQASQDSSTLSEVNVEKVLNDPTAADSKTCVNSGCTNMAVFAEDRGQEYCSSECVVKHSRDVFDSWISSRKIKV